MKMTRTPLIRPTLRWLVLALAVTALSGFVVRGTPYAASVTKSGNTVSFVLNQNAAGLVVLRNGANPVYPGTTAGTLSFDMTGYTSYQIIVTGNTATGWSQYIPDGTSNNFYLAYGVAINKNPASTNFGKVYVAEAQGGTTGAGRTTTSGIYWLGANGADLGFHTGGVNWTTIGNASPFKSTIGPDDHLYTASYSEDLAYEFNDDLSVATKLIDASNKTASQYVESIWVEGTRAAGNRKIYLVDSLYTDARVGLISYDLGANATATPGDTGTQVIGPSYFAFYPRDVVRDSSGNWYMNQYRATAGQAPVITKFDGTLALPINTALWEASSSYTYGYGIGLNEGAGRVAYADNIDGHVYFFDMATGNFVESMTAGSSLHDVDFDAAGNMVTTDTSLERARFWSPGGYTVTTTGSDGTFTLTKPSVNVSVTATTPITSMDLSQPPGVFTVTRSVTGATLPVGYTLTGTATNGVHYQLLSGTVTFQPADITKDILVTAIPFTPAGPTRSVILTLNTSNTYAPVAPFTDTVFIADTNKPSIHIAARDTQFYERTNDFARFTLTRWGDTNVYLSQVNVTYAGTATEDVHFYGTPNTNMSYGVETVDVMAFPICDGVVTGPKTVTATVAAAGDDSYIVGTPATSGAVTRVDSDDPPETVLWSDDFSKDTSANWTILFATTNGVAPDYCINAQPDGSSLPLIGPWPFDYSALGIPSAPHTKDGSTHGLYMTVNKDDTVLAAAALNFYPNGQSFSGNYALRFDMFLIENSSTSTTEYGLFGINHSGTKTNWFRGTTTGFTGVDPVGWNFDGVFYAVESDASGLGDYVGYSSPTTANHNPTAITPGVNASALTGVFKAPPWTAGGTAIGGSPANVYGSTTPIWADVELKQVNGVLYWSVNHTLIFAYTNATGYTSGNIMLGYTDAYDSIGATGGSVIYANARVISLAQPRITKVVLNGSNAEITFAANAGDVPTQFTLQSASPVNSTYTDGTSTITSLGGGIFKAVKSIAGNQQFYRIRRIE
jgi:hypothetical protein